MDSVEAVHTGIIVHPKAGVEILPQLSPKDGSLDKSNYCPAFCPVDIGVLLEEAEQEVPWILEGYLASGIFTLLVGPPKLGKTTFAYDAIVAIASGKPFLGRDVIQSNVLLLGMEEHRRDIVSRLRDRSENDLSGRIKVAFGPLPYNDQILNAIFDYIDHEQIGLVVVDTLPAWWRLTEENDAGKVLQAGMPLVDRIHASKAAWLCLAHTRKAGGQHGDEIRGSSAFAGLVDMAISMKRESGNESRRCLESISRYDETPEKLIVVRSDDGYMAVGTPDQVSVQAKAEKFWEALTDQDQLGQTLMDKVGITKQDLSRVCAHLGSKVARSGKGHKGSPFMYRRNSILTVPSSENRPADESNSIQPAA